jgi:hypothetical protein
MGYDEKFAYQSAREGAFIPDKWSFPKDKSYKHALSSIQNVTFPTICDEQSAVVEECNSHCV